MATEKDSTPHPHYAECPDDPTTEVRGEGEPLRMSRTRGPPATYDGDALEGFVAETCASLYAEDVADEIEDRTGHEFRQTVRDEGSRTGPDEPYVAAYLLFDFQTGSGELREAPPIGFDRYREAAPSSLTASVIVNDETHECTVPVRVGCSRLVLD